MADGYMDKILSVDLTSKGVKVESTDKEIARNYIGGKGYATYLLYQFMKKYEDPREIDPLGPDNVLIFATGPGTGWLAFHPPGDTTSWLFALR